MTTPTIRVELAFDASPFEPDPTWTTLDPNDVLSASIQEGRKSTTDVTTPPSSLAVRLDNSRRTYDPTHSAGTYYNKLLSGLQIRVTAIEADDTETVVFRGVINADGWQQTDYSLATSACSVVAIDVFATLAARNSGRPLFEAYIERLAVAASLEPKEFRHWPLDDSSDAREGAQTFTDRRNYGHQNVIESPAIYRNLFFTSNDALTSSAVASGRPLRLGNSVDAVAGAVRVDMPRWAHSADKAWTVGWGFQLDALPPSDAMFMGQSFYYPYGWTVDRDGTFKHISDLGNELAADIKLEPGVKYYQTTTWDPATTTMRIYLNGELTAEDTSYPATTGDTKTTIYFSYGRINPDYVNNSWPYIVGDAFGALLALTEAEARSLYRLWNGIEGAPTIETAGVILDALGIPHALEGGGRVAVAATTEGAAATLQAMERTELGRLYYDHATQAVVFISSAELLTTARHTTPQLALTDDPADNTGLRYMAPSIVTVPATNRAAVTSPSDSVELSDTASVLATGTSDSALNIQSEPFGDAYALAEWLLATNSVPKVAVEAVTIRPTTSAATKRLLARRLFDRVTFRRHPHSIGAASSAEYLIEGRSYTWSDGTNMWFATLFLGEPDDVADGWWLWGTGKFHTESEGVLHP